MTYNNLIKWTFFIALFILSSCVHKHIPTSKGGYIYSGIYFGSYFTKHYKEGIRNGCDTAKGIYTKGHWLFKNSSEYKKGWFLGRHRCRKLLRLDKNGDLDFH